MNIWIIGAGAIGLEYAKVLTDLNVDYIVIGRGENSAKKFEEATGHNVIRGGLHSYIETMPPIPNKAIVAVGVEELSETIQALIKYGVCDIFAEKPGFCDPLELDATVSLSRDSSANIYLAYNRRFYASTLLAEKIIEADGGLISVNFEFTEWAHIIGSLNKSKSALKNWFYANSTHVVDLAFYIAGMPKDMTSYSLGNLSWHTPSVFAGSGITSKDILFTYQANWEAPGRWAIELLTKKHRLYLKPMETLQIQKIGSVIIEVVEDLDDKLDKEYKPGFYLETKAFVEGDYSHLCSINHQVTMVNCIYSKMLK